ncbi:MAG TPA: AbrB/MazE/SpoVT family DNA-binding domain-containing protein [Thermoanaerobaculia bacterium]|nr:AbrB/MazE/SpoVT family DNA-binding domain-containing protein [Thermoanaerobaculia bacterium]
MVATLDKFGRIVIPKRVREDFGLDPGTVLEIEGDRGRIVLYPRRTEPDLVREDGVLIFTGEAAGDLEGAVEVQRRRRARHAAAWGDW